MLFPSDVFPAPEAVRQDAGAVAGKYVGMSYGWGAQDDWRTGGSVDCSGLVVNGVGETSEIDFVATKGQDRRYIQVTLSMVDPKVADRELKVLLGIGDNYPKTILSMDYHNEDQVKGIELINIMDFLLS